MKITLISAILFFHIVLSSPSKIDYERKVSVEEAAKIPLPDKDLIIDGSEGESDVRTHNLESHDALAVIKDGNDELSKNDEGVNTKVGNKEALDGETPKEEDTNKGSSIVERFKNSYFWNRIKFFFQYWARQFFPSSKRCRGENCFNTFLKLNRSTKYEDDYNEVDRERAADAMQYAIIGRHMVRLDGSPKVLGEGAGLCDTYHLRAHRVSEFYGTKFALYESKHRFVLAFKGTTTLQELFKVDANLVRFKCKLHGHCGSAHKGFLLAFADMKPALHTLLGLIRRKPLIVTGHSLGGSFATLTAYHFKLRYNKLVEGVYTFGSPKVGNQLFQEGFDSIVSSRVPVVRTILADEIRVDIVSTIPGNGYQHVAKDQRSLILKCINEAGRQCTILELHNHWYYITALGRLANRKCGLFKEDINPPLTASDPPLSNDFS